MALNLRMPETNDLRPRITVFGVGGAGGNAVNNMIDKNLDGAEFVVANTDAQALSQSQAPKKIQLGERITEGLGAGAKPEVGNAAATESIDAIIDHLSGAHMCFITAGMGGGTGTGAAPVIANAARELGVLTVGVVTKPFQFEGARRMRQAEAGVEELQKVVDTLIIIPNQNLFRLANENTTFTDAFSMADDVLYQGVKGVTDLMVRPGIINLDFADVRSVMDEMGKAMMGTGEAEGEDRARKAAELAIANPLLDEISLKSAKGVLINITGSQDMTLFELDEAANRIREEVDPDAHIIVGSTLDPDLEGLRVSVVATGIDVAESEMASPVSRRPMREPLKLKPETVVAPEEEISEVATAAVVAEPVVPVAPAAVAQTLTEDVAVAEVQEAPVADNFIDQRATMEAEVAAPPAPAEVPADTTARLQAAVAHMPELVKEAPATAPEKPSRSVIRTLINQMKGQSTEGEPAPRVQPSMRSGSQAGQALDLDREEQERIEIPAFLRRQAN
ncbi:MAG: cell division protein FtsZ [Rhodobacteraceae bacterium]|nr:cell division protein FtsZ [Paracoccaceae bacterium]